MDKMVILPNDEVVITNDGATILQKLEVQHPTAKMVRIIKQLSNSCEIVGGIIESTRY
jgi:chaperonin GroEL (HSP60 family)